MIRFLSTPPSAGCLFGFWGKDAFLVPGTVAQAREDVAEGEERQPSPTSVLWGENEGGGRSVSDRANISLSALTHNARTLCPSGARCVDRGLGERPKGSFPKWRSFGPFLSSWTEKDINVGRPKAAPTESRSGEKDAPFSFGASIFVLFAQKTVADFYV